MYAIQVTKLQNKKFQAKVMILNSFLEIYNNSCSHSLSQSTTVK